MLLVTGLFGKWPDILPQTSVSLLPKFVSRPDFWGIQLFSVACHSEISHLSADNLPILLWTALACSTSMEMSSRWEKTEHLWRFPLDTRTCSARHFTQARNDYTSRIRPLINITLKHKRLVLAPTQLRRGIWKEQSVSFSSTVGLAELLSINFFFFMIN